jgi:hypothetical protein
MHHLKLQNNYVLVLIILSIFCQSCKSTQTQYMGNRYVVADQTQNFVKTCDKMTPAKSWAVITGINFYQDSRISDLKGAVDDAWNFYHYLVSPKGARFNSNQVRLLLNEQATRAGIEDALGQFLTAACPQDKVIIYFAGHGAPEPDRSTEAFLLVHDTNLDSMVSSAISMSQLPKFLQWRTGNTANLLMLIDACHSGNIKFPNSRGVKTVSLNQSDLDMIGKKRAKSVNTTLQKVVKSQNGWGAISATASDQIAGESGGVCQLSGKDYNGGLFTCTLLESFNGIADTDTNQQLSLDELFNHVSNRLVEMRGLDQIPQKSGNMNGLDQIFPTIDQRLELPQVPMRYRRKIHPQPYRKWLYGSMTLTSVALASSIAMNFITNQSARDTNQYTATAATQLSGAQGYKVLDEQYEQDRSLTLQMYITTAILGAVTSSLFTMDLLHKPESEADVYRKKPGLIIERKTQ